MAILVTVVCLIILLAVVLKIIYGHVSIYRCKNNDMDARRDDTLSGENERGKIIIMLSLELYILFVYPSH